ncbi:MAG: hypothetical protein HXK55_03985 [Bacteroidetes bacterium]|nr:hypothetical protein [Bacteroidota bacterium]
MKNKRKIILTIALICSATIFCNAQNGLAIRDVFERYGRQRGVTMVEISGESFGGYKLSLFKSLSIDKDRRNARKVKEVVVDGVVRSILLDLPRQGKMSRLILYNDDSHSKNAITLIYIETEENGDDILKFILKEK